MYLKKKFFMKALFILMLCFSVLAVSGVTNSVTVEAAVKAPSVKESKKTLYVGYENYTIKISNLAAKAVVTYHSSNTKVAKVSSKGVVSPVGAGSTAITASVKQKNKTYKLKVNVTVEKPNVKLTKSTTYLNVGETYLFKANAYGVDATITWSVSDTTIATIGSSGKVTAVTSGIVTVTAEAGGVTTSCELTVGSNRLGTFSEDITIYDDFTIWITVPDVMEDEALYVEPSSSEIVECKWASDWEGDRYALTISPVAVGTETIIITTNKSNDELWINVNVVEKPKNRVKLDSEAVYDKCGPSTVEITASDDYDSWLGSGFFVDDGMIVTNYHVIEGANKIVVKTADKKEYTINTIIGYDKTLDLAILAINAKRDILTISQDKVAVGQEIYTLGSPFGLTGTMTKGMVSTASRDMGDGVDYVQIDAAISHGNSGGPLVNSYGEVIGINTMYIGDGQNLNFAVSIKELQKINTNHPIAVKDYYELYMKQWLEEFKAKMIHEDPIKSQSADCQEVPSGVGVDGTMVASQKADAYYFVMDQPGYFEAYIYYDTVTDMENMGFLIMDEDYNYVEASEYQDGTEYMYQYLTPGTYLILIGFTSDNYTGNDINYMFVTYHY